MNQVAVLKVSTGEELLIKSTPFIIGSFDAACQYTYKNNDVAPIHCQIILEEDGWKVQDMNAKTGITLNQVEVPTGETKEILDGDEIGVADITFQFIYKNELITHKEMDMIKDQYNALLSTKDETKIKNIGKETILLLWEKIEKVNEIAGNGTMAEDAQGYLSEIFKDMFHKSSNDSNPVAPPLQEQVVNADKRRIVEPIQPSPVIPQKSAPQSSSIASRRVAVPPIQKRQVQSAQPNSNRNPQAPIMNRAPIQVQPQNRMNTNTKMCFLVPVKLEIDAICVRKTPFQIGKSEYADYVLNERGISRNHAEIIQDTSRNCFIVKDNGSTNGTFVNGNRLNNSETMIRIGDIVTFYNCEFKVTKA